MPYGEAFCQLPQQFAIGEIDKSRCVSYFSTVPYIIWFRERSASRKDHYEPAML